MLFRFFSVKLSSRKYCCVQNCKVDELPHNGTLYKGKVLNFFWCFASCRSRKKIGFGYTTIILEPEKNPTYKAAFGVNRFENILGHLRFDDKRARAE